MIVNFRQGTGASKKKQSVRQLGSLRLRDCSSGNQKPGDNGHFCSVNFTYRRATWILLRGGGGTRGAWSQNQDLFVQRMIYSSGVVRH